MPRILSLAALLLALPAAAGTVVPLTRAELVARSDTIVRVRVLSRTPLRSSHNGRILTESRLQALETYKGPLRPELVLVQIGGTLEGRTQVLPGDAAFAVGEEAVVLLRCTAEGRCHLSGLGLGKWSVEEKDGRRLAVRRAEGVVDAAGNRVPEESLPLDQLARELRSAR